MSVEYEHWKRTAAEAIEHLPNEAIAGIRANEELLDSVVSDLASFGFTSVIMYRDLRDSSAKESRETDLECDIKAARRCVSMLTDSLRQLEQQASTTPKNTRTYTEVMKRLASTMSAREELVILAGHRRRLLVLDEWGDLAMEEQMVLDKNFKLVPSHDKKSFQPVPKNEGDFELPGMLEATFPSAKTSDNPRQAKFVNFLVREYSRLGDVPLDKIGRTTRWVDRKHTNIGRFVGRLAREHPLFEMEGCGQAEYEQFVERLLKGKILPEIDRELQKTRVAACVAEMTMEQSKQVFEIQSSDLPQEEKEKAIRSILKIDD